MNSEFYTKVMILYLIQKCKQVTDYLLTFVCAYLPFTQKRSPDNWEPLITLSIFLFIVFSMIFVLFIKSMFLQAVFCRFGTFCYQIVIT